MSKNMNINKEFVYLSSSNANKPIDSSVVRGGLKDDHLDKRTVSNEKGRSKYRRKRRILDMIAFNKDVIAIRVAQVVYLLTSFYFRITNSTIFTFAFEEFFFVK